MELSSLFLEEHFDNYPFVKLPQFFEDEKIPMSLLLQHIVMFYKYGGKQLYYNNTHDGAGEMNTGDDVALEQVDYDSEEACDSCAI